MKRTLADFGELTAAERKLRDWLQSGNRKTCEISGAVPDSASDDVTLRSTFLRYLALGGCDDCGLPETGLQVVGAYIQGDDGMSEETKGLDLEGATLPGDLGVMYCHIPNLILLRFVKLKNLFLNGSHLKQGLNANRLQAEGSVFLRGANIQGEVQLPGAKLGGNLVCTGARLTAEGKALSCDGLQAEGSVFLRGAQVQGEVRLLGAKLGGDLVCTGARLTAEGKALSCVEASIKGGFFLRNKAQVTGCIDLTAANIGAIADDPDCWPPEVLLVRCRYGAFQGNNAPTDAKRRLRWLALQQPRNYGQDFWPDPYEHCAKVLREMGHGADARTILIEKERLQRKARRDRLLRALVRAKADKARTPDEAGFNRHSDRVSGIWLSLLGLRVWDGILGAVVGYGRRPQNAAWWALSIWLVGFLVFANAAGHGAIKPNLPQIQLNPAWTGCANDPRGQLGCFLNHPDAASYPRFNAAIYPADTLVPVVSFEMQSYWIPDDRTDRGMLARGYLWFHIAMGWALTLLAVAGFSGLIKSDNTK